MSLEALANLGYDLDEFVRLVSNVRSGQIHLAAGVGEPDSLSANEADLDACLLAIGLPPTLPVYFDPDFADVERSYA